MDTFNLKEYLANNPLLNELAMERAEIYPIVRNFLSNYSLDGDLEREASNQIAMDLVKDFKKFDQVKDKKDLPIIVMNMEDEFIELFDILDQYFNFEGKSPEDMLTAFINYLRK